MNTATSTPSGVTLSLGAQALYLARQREPGKTQRYYGEIIGRKERQIRNLTRELREAGLLNSAATRFGFEPTPVRQARPGVTDDLTDAQRQVFERLVGIAYDLGASREAVLTYPLELIQAGLAYVKQNAWRLANPAGYLRVWLGYRMAQGDPLNEPIVQRDPVAPDPICATLTEVETPAPDLCELPNDVRSEVSTDDSASDLCKLPNEVASGLPLLTAGNVLMPTTEDFLLLCYTVEAATGCDLNLQPSGVGQVQRLYSTGYRADDVVYFLKELWPSVWPGKNGEPPTLQRLMEHIGLAKHLLNMSQGSRGDELAYRVATIRQRRSAGEVIHSLDELHSFHPDRVTSTAELAEHPYREHPRLAALAESRYKALVAQDKEECRAEEERERQRCPTCQRLECRCAALEALPYSRRRIEDMWRMTKGQLQVELNHATYDTWVRHAEVAGYEDHHLIIEVPNPYAKDWIEQHLLAAMEEKFNRALGLLHFRKEDMATLHAKSLAVAAQAESCIRLAIRVDAESEAARRGADAPLS